MSTTPNPQAASPRPSQPATSPGPGGGPRASRAPSAGWYGLVVLVSLGIWAALSTRIDPLFLPGPQRVAVAAWELTREGSLAGHVGASYFRVLTGWFLGSLIAIPIGLLAGRLWYVRLALSPYVNFFRFVPPIAFVTLALIYFGIGETSKVVLVMYASMFIVLLNTMDGVQRVSIDKLRAAASLGATRRQVLWTVVVPATIPEIITGLRVSMGAAFMTVIAAELVAAQSGVGFLIFRARVLARTDIVFLGIMLLGAMGFLADWLFRMVIERVAYRYEIRI